ncbi:MAG: efflux RND transporter permease subunit [Desulfobacterales bacterium]|jgi:multidrug efflux pump subunit AcrB
MKRAVKWMTINHVAANLLMLVFVVGGLLKMVSIKQEVFPEVTLDMVQISVEYPGAGPEEVEEGIILSIEDSLTSIDGIDEITAVAAEGRGTVTAEIQTGENTDLILQDIKSEIDRIVTFPENAEKPVVTKITNLREVVSVAVYGDVTERALREQAETIREELLTYPQITQVKLGGLRPYEISVEIPESNLQQYNLTLDQVAAAIRRASLDLPGGNIKTTGGQILLRTKEKRYQGPEYADIIILADPNGVQVRLGDIATIKDTFEDNDLSATFDGKPAGMVKVFRVADQRPIQISEIVKQYVADKEAGFPESIHVAVWNDSSEIFKSRMNLLIKNAGLGLILVMIVLGLFLEIRLALWVMLGIPISFLGAFSILPALDVSVNMISLFAFILALGILVDDAIVVGENIFEHRQTGKPYLQAAIDGALEVSIPVTFSILTTVAAFTPLLFVSGTMGKFMKAIPLVVISLLMVSLIESLFILPAHLSNGKKRRPKGRLLQGIENIRLWFSNRLERMIAGPYQRLLRRCLSYRYVVFSMGLAILMISVGFVRGGILKFSFMPEVEGDLITVSLRMPPGTPVEKTDRIAQTIIEKGMATVAEIDRNRPKQKSIFSHAYAVIGGTMVAGGPLGGESTSGTHLADIALLLTQSEARNYPTAMVVDGWRQKVGTVPGIDSLTFSSNLVHMGADIDVQMAHSDFSVLETAADRLKATLSEYPGVEDIEDTYSQGKQELKLKLQPEARTLGITEEDLARQVRAAFYGSEALRLQIARNEVKVMVRYPKADRKSLWELEAMRIRTPGGGEIPLRRAAEVIEGRGYSEINRTDRKRVVNVTATVNSSRANASEILADLKKSAFAQLQTDFPGLDFDFAGEQKEQREVMGSMADGFLLALLAIYALMAVPFKSYTQPLLIMTAIPFGIVGAVIGHLIMGYQLSILSLFGVVALSGVVVNDSLILIDKINNNRKAGMGHFEAVVNGGMRRFRPILLTSLTTFFGLTPMIFETSVQAQFLIPMAISLGFGILFATGITLLLIPSLYMILEDLLYIITSRKSAKLQNSKIHERFDESPLQTSERKN